MPTPLDDLYTAAKGIMADVNTAASTTLAQAPTNYGTDFRITAGQALYQVQISPVNDYARSSNDSHPRAVVTVLIHHYVSSLANEELFINNAMSYVADKLLVSAIWAAEVRVFGFQPDGDSVVEAEVGDGERIGNVITFEVSAVVLADAA